MEDVGRPRSARLQPHQVGAQSGVRIVEERRRGLGLRARPASQDVSRGRRRREQIVDADAKALGEEHNRLEPVTEASEGPFVLEVESVVAYGQPKEAALDRCGPTLGLDDLQVPASDLHDALRDAGHLVDERCAELRSGRLPVRDGAEVEKPGTHPAEEGHRLGRAQHRTNWTSPSITTKP
ncbi:MAG TPA: hypothetical protein VNC22_02140, partial [Sporichthya sp.]|nr:hypothetical protein [Sporichthya sp.]